MERLGKVIAAIWLVKEVIDTIEDFEDTYLYIKSKYENIKEFINNKK